MKAALKKGISLGIEAVKLSKDRIGKKVKSFVNAGYVSRKDAGVIVRTIVSAVKREQNRIKRLAGAEAKKALREIGIVSVNEGKLLKKRLKNLESIVRKKGARIVRRVTRGR